MATGDVRRRLRRRQRPTITLTVTLEFDGLDKMWIAEVDQLPGCMSQGETEAEALENINDAIGGVLAVILEDQSPEGQRRHEAPEPAPNRHPVKVAIGA